MCKKIAILITLLILGLVLVVYLVGCSEKRSAGYSGIVVPHHDMVRSFRMAFLAEVAKVNNPQTIVLISPDHFDTNRFPITASTKVWELSSVTILPDLKLIENLGVAKDSGDFINEHGITTVLSDLGKTFPKAEIVPVMINAKVKESELRSFIDLLYLNCEDCLLVASVDFSHSLQVDVASLHDVLTLRSLYQLNSHGLYDRAEVDSPGSLLALTYWANKHNTNKFDLFSHTNSGELSKTSVGEMTTHIIGGYRVGEMVTELNDSLTMMFGGDVMFARGVAEQYKNNPAEALTKSLGDRTFWGADLSVVNLEGLFASEDGFENGWNTYPPIFRFDSVYIKALQSAKIDVAGLSNNHNQDGKPGEYDETVRVLNENDVLALETAPKSNTPIIRVVGNTKVALFGYSLFEKSDDLAPLIYEYKNNGYRVVIFVHYGNEYDIKPIESQVEASRRFIDAGASLIVGSHPHILQPVDVYKGVPIVYSLGNLLFDQKHNGAEVGALLGVRFEGGGLTLFLTPINTYLEPKFINYDLSPLLTRWVDNLVPGSGRKYFFPYN